MTFNPRDHITMLKGKEYLEARWRLVWLRDVYPNAKIETQHIDLDLERGHAVFRAVVTFPDGGGATGYGSETRGDFGDFIEKAETKAIARALAAAGFGTQFTGDELAEGERIADSPVQLARQRQIAELEASRSARTVNAIANPSQEPEQSGGREQAAAFFFAQVQAKGLSEDERRVLQRIVYGKESAKDLSERELRSLGEWMRKQSPEQLRMKIAERLALDEPVDLAK